MLGGSDKVGESVGDVYILIEDIPNRFGVVQGFVSPFGKKVDST